MNRIVNVKPVGGPSSSLLEADHLVFEAEHRPRVDVEREVEVDRAGARLLGVQVDLPELAK